MTVTLQNPPEALAADRAAEPGAAPLAADSAAAAPVPATPGADSAAVDAAPAAAPARRPRRRRPQGGTDPGRSGQAPAVAQERPATRDKDRQKGRQGDRRPAPARAHHPLLDQLAEHYPALFGARFRPLKLGTYDDILARQPGVYDPEALKLALGQHARSTRYLEAVATGDRRHDLDGQPVEDVAPEHRLHAIMEVRRRRQARSPADLGPWLLDRVVAAVQASGLARADYLERIRTQDPQTLAVVEQAFEQITQQTARREALRRAYAASGKSPAEFADMYGLDLRTVTEALETAAP